MDTGRTFTRFLGNAIQPLTLPILLFKAHSFIDPHHKKHSQGHSTCVSRGRCNFDLEVNKIALMAATYFGIAPCSVLPRTYSAQTGSSACHRLSQSRHSFLPNCGLMKACTPARIVRAFPNQWLDWANHQFALKCHAAFIEYRRRLPSTILVKHHKRNIACDRWFLSK